MKFYLPGKAWCKAPEHGLLPERPIRMDANNFAPRVGVATDLATKPRSGLAQVYFTL